MPTENTAYFWDLTNQHVDMLGPLRISRRIFHGVLVSQSQSSTHSATMTANVNVVQQHFVHLPERAVIICRLCGYVMNPDRGVQRHLTDIHQAIPLGVWKQLVACSKSIWIGSPDEIIAPSRISLPIQGLSLPKGWKCDRCGYVSLKGVCENIADGNIDGRKHKALGQCWQQQHVQTIFPSTNRKYLVVTPIVEQREPESSGIMVDDCIKALLEEAEGIDVKEDDGAIQGRDRRTFH
jgi:Orsellinic acid/F9775 biosynthesis cluster protein D